MPRTHYFDEEVFRSIRAEDANWKPFPAFPPAARMAILVGDSARPGPQVVRVHLPAGTQLMPHKRPEDRIYTVISDVIYIGLGGTFDVSKLGAYAPGSLVALPGGRPHFHWAKSGDYITQVTTIGPLGMEYVRAEDDPCNADRGTTSAKDARKLSSPQAV